MVSTAVRTDDVLTSLAPQGGPLPLALGKAFEAWTDADPLEAAECREVLSLLQTLGCDDETMAAALWFYTARKHPSDWEKLEKTLPASLARLVAGQLAAEHVSTLHAEHSDASEGLRRLLLAIVLDLRVVFVLLSRQLARLRHADDLPAQAALDLAHLTSDIHAPLANRLGIWQLKWELEDLAFRQLQPNAYKHIARLLDERRTDREHFIDRCIHELTNALAAAGIETEVAGRAKHIYSIWKKMQRKQVAFADLYDIFAVRVQVKDVAACYAALGVVHGLWPHLPHEFDDYIARPKSNGYRSLHTAVFGPEGRAVEVQIRTAEMHRTCELGVAAHWRYKEGGSGDAAFEDRIAWMRRLLETRDEDDSLSSAFRTELIEDRVYLLTPRGDVLDVPRGGTVLDFAYRVHTEVGHRCRGAKVNGRIVPLTFQPESGDRVEILTGKVSKPRRDWLSPQHGYLNNPRSRERVRAWFRRGEREANVTAGRVVFEKELKRLALEPGDTEVLLKRLGLKTQEDLFEALALGEVTSGQVARVLHEPDTKPPRPVAPPVRPPDGTGALNIEGVGNLLTTLARCCQPLPGDRVRGFITRGRGVSVHRADCASLSRLMGRDPDRVIEVAWGNTAEQAYQVDITIRGYDRKGLHKDVAALITAAATPVIGSSSRADPGHGMLDMHFTLRVRDFEQLSTLMSKLSALQNVVDVRRLVA